MLTSWLEIPDTCDFSLQNIPFGICSLSSSNCHRCVTAIGNTVVDLDVLQDAGVFSDIASLDPNVFSHSTLNPFLEHPPSVWTQVRQRITDLFTKDKIDLLSSNENLRLAALHDMDHVIMCLPVDIGDYTDFYSSREHATNGRSIR
jgi:fumarylacetoacetase